jgi:hypothetical protein
MRPRIARTLLLDERDVSDLLAPGRQGPSAQGRRVAVRRCEPPRAPAQAYSAKFRIRLHAPRPCRGVGFTSGSLAGARHGPAAVTT